MHVSFNELSITNNYTAVVNTIMPIQFNELIKSVIISDFTCFVLPVIYIFYICYFIL